MENIKVESIYFLTSLDKLVKYTRDTVIFDFKPYKTKDEAIQQIPEFRSLNQSNEFIPLIGRLEIPSSFESTISQAAGQASAKILVQAGYDPSVNETIAREYRIKVRQSNLARISTLAWTEMIHDPSSKIQSLTDAERQVELLKDYFVLNGAQDDQTLEAHLFESKANRDDYLNLANAAAEKISTLDKMREKSGFTQDEYEFVINARNEMMTAYCEYFRVESRRLAVEAHAAKIPELRDLLNEKAFAALERYQVLYEQVQVGVLYLLSLKGLTDGSHIMNIGHDEVAELNATGQEPEDLARTHGKMPASTKESKRKIPAPAVLKSTNDGWKQHGGIWLPT